MILLYAVLFILIVLVATVFSYYVGLRAVGVKAGVANVFKLAILLLALQVLATTLSYLLGDSPVTIIVTLGWFVGAFIAWHKLLNRYHSVNIGKSLGAYVIGGIIAAVLCAIVAVGMLSFVQSFKISGDAMNPSLRNEDRVLVYKKGEKLEVNKIVAYNYKMNEQNGKTIGRILYAPGQNVSIKTQYLDANGALAEPADYVLKESEYYIVADNKEVTIPRIISEENIIGVVGPTIIKAK